MLKIKKIKEELCRRINNFATMRNEAAIKGEKNERVDGVLAQLNNFLAYIEMVEQEPMDLEKELEIWRHKHFNGKRDGDYSGEYLERESQLDLASYFYELGLNARKK